MFARFPSGLLRLLLERQLDVTSVPLFCRDVLGLRDRRRLGALFDKAYQPYGQSEPHSQPGKRRRT